MLKAIDLVLSLPARGCTQERGRGDESTPSKGGDQREMALPERSQNFQQ